MLTSSHVAALATLALVLSLASAQGPECKTGPHPTVLAVQQKCAKGSLLCKEVEVTNCALSNLSPQPLPSTPPLNLKPFTIPNVSRTLRSTSFPSTWTLPRPSKKFSTHQVPPALPPAAPSRASPPPHWHSAIALAIARDSESVCGAVIPILNHKETEYATVLSASDGTKYIPAPFRRRFHLLMLMHPQRVLSLSPHRHPCRPQARTSMLPALKKRNTSRRSS